MQDDLLLVPPSYILKEARIRLQAEEVVCIHHAVAAPLHGHEQGVWQGRVAALRWARKLLDEPGAQPPWHKGIEHIA